jgi:hypothetical protein
VRDGERVATSRRLFGFGDCSAETKDAFYPRNSQGRTVLISSSRKNLALTGVLRILRRKMRSLRNELPFFWGAR